MQKSIYRICILILFLQNIYAKNEKYKLEHIGREQGLTANSVLSIAQDQQGFIWFGTEDGLFRFDGYRMTAYKYDPLDSTSLGNNNVFAIVVDRNGTLWIGTAGGGLNRFDREKEQFTRFKHNPDNPNSISADVVSALFEDTQGILWAGTWQGLNKVDAQNGTITRFVHDSDNPSSMNPHWNRSICEDSTGSIWVGTDGGISRLNQESGEFSHFVENREIPGSLSSNAVRSVYKDRLGNMWIGSWGGLNRFNYGSQNFAGFHSRAGVTAICEDRTGVLWIGTSRGLYYHSGNETTPAFEMKEVSADLSEHIINAIFEDNTGTLWIGSDHGVYKLDREQYRFKNLVHDPENPNSLSQNRIRAMCEDSHGSIWIATAGEGLTKYDPRAEKFQSDFPGLENEGFSPGPGTNYPVFSLFSDKSGRLWIGQFIGMGCYNPDKKLFQRYIHKPGDPGSMSGNDVWRIHEDRLGRIWVATHKDGPTGIDRFDNDQGIFTHIKLAQEIHSGYFKRNGVHHISEGKTGRLWFATMGDGVFLLNPGDEAFVQFNHEPGNTNSLSNGWVGVVHEDNNGMVWAAPWYGGLNKLDPLTGRVTIYSEKHGLPSNYISSITEDDHGHLWLTTKNGLSRFDPVSATFRNFDGNDGLINIDFDHWNVSVKSSSGKLYFGGEKGIDYVHPDSIRDNPHVPPVVFTRFTRYNSSEVKGKMMIEKGISVKKQFDLSFRDHTLNFDFAALNFRNPQKNQYAYKLEGFDENWIDLGNKHEVTFTNLDPGKYILHVKGSNNDGVWNEKGASLIITISPPWWNTKLAYVLYIVFIGLVLYGVRRYELKRVGLRNELEKQSFQAQNLRAIDQLKSRFFANISHEFRTPLTLILGPLQKYLSDTKDKEKREDLRIMHRNAHRLQQLIDQLLDLSKIEARKMPLHAKAHDIVQRVKEWAASFASLAESKNIAFKQTYPPEPVIVYFDAEKLEKVIYNLLSNAFKFTPDGGSVELKLAINPLPAVSPLTKGRLRGVEIKISDSEAGIRPEHIKYIFDRFHSADESNAHGQSSTGIGLALTKELVDLHHGIITVDSEVGKGSVFTVTLPLGNEHLSTEEIVEPTAKSDEKSTSASLSLPEAYENEMEKMPADEKQTAEGNGKQPHLLIVEDNADMRRFLRNCLAEDFEIAEAENGKKGFTAALKTIPDLIVSDVMMPEMDGYQFCAKLKTDQRTSHIPVILLTALAARENKIEGLETGADDYLVKPFEAKELIVRAKNLIRQRQRLHERFNRDITVKPKDITVTSIDEQFLQRAIDIVEQNISDNDFKTEDFADAIGMSRPTLNRKLRSLTGFSTNEFIRTMRLKRAAQLLGQRSATIVEIAYSVGFNNPSYFADCFRQQFAKLPSEYEKDG